MKPLTAGLTPEVSGSQAASPLAGEAVAELHLVPLGEEGQEFRQGHVLRRAGAEPCACPEFARHDVSKRPGRDALRVFGDEFDDFVPVGLFGGHAGSLPPARPHGTERKCWRREKQPPTPRLARYQHPRMPLLESPRFAPLPSIAEENDAPGLFG